MGKANAISNKKRCSYEHLFFIAYFAFVSMAAASAFVIQSSGLSVF